MKLVIICSAFCITACFNSKRHNIPSIFSKSSVNFINKVWIENANRSLFPISLSKSCRFLMSFALLQGLLLNFESAMTRYYYLGISSKNIAIQGIVLIRFGAWVRNHALKWMIVAVFCHLLLCIDSKLYRDTKPNHYYVWTSFYLLCQTQHCCLTAPKSLMSCDLPIRLLNWSLKLSKQ